jgi:hypothetical protein
MHRADVASRRANLRPVFDPDRPAAGSTVIALGKQAMFAFQYRQL